jgi:branched-chain amino acid aminotransferase
MAHIYGQAYFGDKIVPFADANLSIASSALLYGLSVYTVFHVAKTKDGWQAFRLPEHFKRLQESAKIIGIEPPKDFSYENFLAAIAQVVKRNRPKGDIFVRASIHVNALLPGTRSRAMPTIFSLFAYDAEPIVPLAGAKLKTSLWRRVPDNSIPSRAKVNGAYVNSVLARQDAIDSGYDDCIFLDSAGHVCELSAANIFMIRRGELITPDTASDILEGITRLSVIELARDQGLTVIERTIDLTELYVADEVFICGTSAFVTPVIEIDARPIGCGEVTKRLKQLHRTALQGSNPEYRKWLTKVD